MRREPFEVSRQRAGEAEEPDDDDRRRQRQDRRVLGGAGDQVPGGRHAGRRRRRGEHAEPRRQRGARSGDVREAHEPAERSSSCRLRRGHDDPTLVQGTTRSAGQPARVDARSSRTVRPARRALDRAADERRADRIEVGGRLVEDDERRVAEKGPREGDSPSLAGRHRAAAVARPPSGTRREARDEVVRAGEARARRTAPRRPRGRRGGCCRRRSHGTASGAAGRTTASAATPRRRPPRGRRPRRGSDRMTARRSGGGAQPACSCRCRSPRRAPPSHRDAARCRPRRARRARRRGSGTSRTRR